MLARGFCHWDQSLPRWLLQELHLALDWASRWPLVLVKHWEAGLVYVICDSTGADERSYPMSEARGSGQEELPHIQGVVAVWVQEGLEELFHLQGQKGWR